MQIVQAADSRSLPKLSIRLREWGSAAAAVHRKVELGTAFVAASR